MTKPGAAVPKTGAADIAAILRRNRLLGELEPGEMAELVALGRLERYAPDIPIFVKGDPGDSLFAILSGQIGIHTSSQDGKVMQLNILNPGDILGEIALLDGKERTASATSLRPTELYRLDRADFIPFLERHPSLCIRMMAVLCERMRWISDTIEDTVFLDVPHRLAKRLLLLADTYGQPGPDGIRITQPVSQEGLANMLGVSREIINKSFASLKKMKALSYTKGFIVLTNPALIRDMAGENQEE